MASLLYCLQKYGQDLSPYHKKQIVDAYKKNLRLKFAPSPAGKNALLDTIDTMETEHATVLKKAQRLIPKEKAKFEVGEKVAVKVRIGKNKWQQNEGKIVEVKPSATGGNYYEVEMPNPRLVGTTTTTRVPEKDIQKWKTEQPLASVRPETLKTAKAQSEAQHVLDIAKELSESKPNVRVRITDIVSRAGLPKKRVHEILKDLQQQDKATLMHLDDPRERTYLDEQDAISILGHKRHIVYFKGYDMPSLKKAAFFVKEMDVAKQSGKGDITTGKTPKPEGGNPFKESIIQDPVYHGTDMDFEKFDLKKSESGLVFFTDKKQIETVYGYEKIRPYHVNVKNPLDLSDLTDKYTKSEWLEILSEEKDIDINRIRLDSGIEESEPFSVYSLFPHADADFKYKKDSNLKQELENQGYDSILFPPESRDIYGVPKGENVIGIFHPEQIKSLPKPSSPPEAGGQTPVEEVKKKTSTLAAGKLGAKQPGPIPTIEHQKLPKMQRRSVTMKKIQKKLDVPIRVGKFRRTVKGMKAAGIYKPQAKVIRLASASDIDTALHEVGHHIQDVLELSDKMPKEVRQMAYKGAEDLDKEGFAEFVRNYVVDPEYAQKNAPEFFKTFEERLAVNTDLQNVLVETRQQYKQFQAAPSVAKVSSFVVSGREKGRKFPSLNKVYTEIKDELYPIKQIVDLAKKRGSEFSAKDDPYLVARLFRGWPRKAEQWLKIKPFQYVDKEGQAVEFKAEALADILAPVEEAGMRQMLDTYLVAKRAVNDPRIIKGFERVLSVEDFKQTVKELEPKFKDYAERLYEYQDELLKYLVDSGRTSQEVAERIRSKNLFHVPFYRLIEHMPEFGSLGKKFGNVFNPIKRLKGSSREVISPTENMMRNTYIFVNASERNRVGNALMKLSKVEGMGKYIERIPFPLKPEKITKKDFLQLVADYGTPERTAEIRESERVVSETLNKFARIKTPGGKMETVVKEALKTRGWSDAEASQIIERVKSAKPSEKADIVEKTIEKTRLMIIKEELGFADMPDSVFHTFRPIRKAGPNEAIFYDKGKPYLFELDPELAKTVTGISGHDLNFLIKAMAFPAKLLRAGATTFSPEFAIRNPLRDQMTAFIQSKYGYVPGIDFVRGLYHILGKTELYQQYNASGAGYSNLVDMDRKYISKNLRRMLLTRRLPGMVKHPLEALQKFSALTEEATRVGEFAKALKKEGKGLDGLLKSGFGAKEVNLDFSRQGRAAARAINLITAFWNARLEGLDKMARSFKDAPMRTAAKAFLGVTLPTVILWAVQKDDEYYQELPEWRKFLFWNIVIRKPDGSLWHILPLPKPFEWGLLFGTIPEQALNWAYTKDPDGMKKAIEQLLKTLDIAPIPTGAIPLMEWWGNKSWYFDRPIVPRDREILDPDLQYRLSTSETVKLASRIMAKVPVLKNVASAAKVENLIRGYTAAFGQLALDGTDWILDAAGVTDAPPEPKYRLTDYPMIRAFRVRFPSANTASIEKFYQEYQRLLTERESAKERDEVRGAGVKGVNAVYNLKQAIENPEGRNLFLAEMTARVLSNLRKEAFSIYKDKELAPDEKRRQLDNTYLRMINAARVYFDKKPLKE